MPETVLVPYKNPPDSTRYAYTASRYNRQFDLDAVALPQRFDLVVLDIMLPKLDGIDAGELVGRDRLACDALQLLDERLLDPGDLDLGSDGRPAGTDGCAADEPEREECDVLGDPLVAHQPPVQPTSLASREDLARDVEGVEPRLAEGWRPEPEVEPRQRHLVAERRVIAGCRTPEPGCRHRARSAR